MRRRRAARGVHDAPITTLISGRGVRRPHRCLSHRSARAGLALLQFLELLEVRVEPREARVPEAPEFLSPLDNFLERRRLEPPRSPLGLASAGDEPGMFEHPEVLGDRGSAHRERRRELLDGGRAGRESGEDRPSRGSAGAANVALSRSVSRHITNRLDNYLLDTTGSEPVNPFQEPPRPAGATEVERPKPASDSDSSRMTPPCIRVVERWLN
jgi:hypothetical protein